LDDGSAFVSGVAGISAGSVTDAAETETAEVENGAGAVENCAAVLSDDGAAAEAACPMAGGGSGDFGPASIGTGELAGAFAALELSGGTTRSVLKFGMTSGVD
jgi:hypothetical protein